MIAIAIAVHVLAVLWWIGGLAFVTAVVLPALRREELGNASAAFKVIESRFAPQARIAVVLVGLSGFYLLARLDLWAWFGQPRFWWLDAMVLFWLLFVALLFVLEPAGLLRRLRSTADESQAWSRILRMHRLLLAAALVIVAGAVAGSHGF